MGALGHERFAWTDQRVEKLKAWWTEGLSASQIATRFGGEPTRNAVIGKVHRLGLETRTGINRRKSHPPKRRVKQRKPKPNGRDFTFGSVSLPSQKRAPGIGQHAPRLAEEEMKRVPFLELETGQCKFPLWSSRDAHRDCCGNSWAGHGPYCSHHARIAGAAYIQKGN